MGFSLLKPVLIREVIITVSNLDMHKILLFIKHLLTWIGRARGLPGCSRQPAADGPQTQAR
jgi:hypothetical protein